jgi:hypothetical protein
MVECSMKTLVDDEISIPSVLGLVSGAIKFTLEIKTSLHPSMLI